MVLSKYLLPLVACFVAARGVAIDLQLEADPATRYSRCYADRGYTRDDALTATNYLISNATFDDGVYLTKSECIYAHAKTTIVSVCNGMYRNRTINRDEVRRGIAQLDKDCGADGNFNGEHVVNNLTFAAYGITGPRPATPVPSSGVSLAKRDDYYHTEKARRLHSRQEAADKCTLQHWNGESRYDCKHANYLAADGTCPGELTPQNKCGRYCEVRRAVFLGIEQEHSDLVYAAGHGKEITKGYETSVSHGFSLNADISKDIFGFGASYGFSYTVTKSKAVTAIPPVDEITEGFGSWVSFPIFVETCGSVTKQTQGKETTDHGPDEDVCVGDVVTLGNQCVTTPALDEDGNARVMWVVRWDFPESGVPKAMVNQTKGYQNVCGNSQDPDKDGEKECQAPEPNNLFRRE